MDVTVFLFIDMGEADLGQGRDQGPDMFLDLDLGLLGPDLLLDRIQGPLATNVGRDHHDMIRNPCLLPLGQGQEILVIRLNPSQGQGQEIYTDCQGRDRNLPLRPRRKSRRIRRRKRRDPGNL